MGRVIAITGVSRGLGRALVRRWVAAGHTVAGCSRSGSALEIMQREHPPPQRFEVVDIADQSDVARWARGVLDSVGVPNLLVNNAGLINKNAALWDVPPEEFQRVINVNVIGAYHVIRHFLPAMATQWSGRS